MYACIIFTLLQAGRIPRKNLCSFFCVPSFLDSGKIYATTGFKEYLGGLKTCTVCMWKPSRAAFAVFAYRMMTAHPFSPGPLVLLNPLEIVYFDIYIIIPYLRSAQQEILPKLLYSIDFKSFKSNITGSNSWGNWRCRVPHSWVRARIKAWTFWRDRCFADHESGGRLCITLFIFVISGAAAPPILEATPAFRAGHLAYRFFSTSASECKCSHKLRCTCVIGVLLKLVEDMEDTQGISSPPRLAQMNTIFMSINHIAFLTDMLSNESINL